MNAMQKILQRNPQKFWWRVSTLVGVSLLGLGLSLAQAQPPAKHAHGKTEHKKVAAKKARHERTGAELYAMNCNRCHSERYPMEHTDAQWKTVMLHMRTRAQIPAKDARAILKYLQGSN